MNYKRVVVLGCGPAGLMAAWAAESLGCNVHIFSRKMKSVIHGAQYLHRPIPGIAAEFSPVEFKKTGTKSGYAEKVYGDPNHPCSWDLFQEGEHEAWSMTAAYDDLWDKFEDRIIDIDINDLVLRYLERSGIDLLISSVPAPLLCRGEHFFEAVPMYIVADDMEADDESNTIVYNGDPDYPWYRTSRLWKHEYLEFGAEGAKMMPMSVLRIGQKPLAHNCDCHPAFMRVGRFGKWERGVLVHHAYEEARDAVLRMQ